jgi:hypothetical protein
MGSVFVEIATHLMIMHICHSTLQPLKRRVRLYTLLYISSLLLNLTALNVIVVFGDVGARLECVESPCSSRGRVQTITCSYSCCFCLFVI